MYDEHPRMTTSKFEGLSNPQLTAHYVKSRSKFRDLLKRAERISRGSAGIESTGNRMFWASVLFTRICVTGMSINKLLPDPKPREHWDFSAAASLVRNLAECFLLYYWLCNEDVDDDMRAARFILLWLHDYGSRRRIFGGPVELEGSTAVFDDLVRQFDSNPYLATFDKKKRKEAIKGERTPFIQDEVLTKLGVNERVFRTMYRFFSQHTHSGPLSFYRMTDHDRGAGVETRLEKIYMTIGMELAHNVVEQAILEHLKIFPDAETRKPHLTRSQIERSVEESQGRKRRREFR